MSEFYDALEVRDPDEREAALIATLPAQVALASARAPAFARLLADVEPLAIDGRDALARLPIIRKEELIGLQREAPPFGGLASTPVAELARIFGSPGPIYEPEARRPDYWRLARALYAAGFRRGELIHNAFSYHLTPAGSMLETGAHALGCPVLPAGVGQTELQVQAIVHLRPAGYVGTPSFLKLLLDKAEEQAADVSCLRKALVSAEALPESLRRHLGERGVGVLQCYATADLGLLAYESEAREGMILDEGILLEIVRPGTGDPVPAGEVGEVVVTTFNPDYPLIRFGTGDLSAVLPGPSPCGRTNTRIRGWMGRADQTTKVRGMFVHPSQVAEVVRRHPTLVRARLVVDRVEQQDRMVLRCEVPGGGGEEGLATAIAATIREVCKVRGEVELTPPGALPNDGRIIDDQRTYD